MISRGPFSLLICLAVVVGHSAVGAFSQVSSFGVRSTSFALQTSSATTTETDDLLKPSYEIEPISIRIGHGFDIHRMAPLEEAGQPVVIGGVEITHKDQKVSWTYTQPVVESFLNQPIIWFILSLILL